MDLVPSAKVRRPDFVSDINPRKEDLPFFHVLGDMKGPLLFRLSMDLHPVIAELIERGAWASIIKLMRVYEYAKSVEYRVSATFVLLQILREPIPDQFNLAVSEAGLEPVNILDTICFLRSFPEYAYFFAEQHLLATGSAWRRTEKPEGEKTKDHLPHRNGWQIPFLPLETDSECVRAGLRTAWPGVVLVHDSNPRDDPRNYTLARVPEINN